MCKNLRTKLRQAAGGPRRLVVVDIENVVGGGVATLEEAAWAMRQIERTVGFDAQDQVLIGVSHFGLVAAGIAWEDSHPRLVVRSGADGADLALLEVLEHEHVADRYDELVLVSGDGIFADVVVRLQVDGLRIRVAAHRDGIARRLAAAAAEVTYLTEHHLPIGGAA